MGDHLMHVISPLLGLAINVITQMAVFKQDKKRKLLRSVAVGFVAGAVSVAVMDGFRFIALVNLMIYASLGYCYFHFINLGETARRIRILRELEGADAGYLESELLERYNARAIIDNRLGRLLRTGQIVLANGRYYIASPVMLIMSRAVQAMGGVVMGKRRRAGFGEKGL